MKSIARKGLEEGLRFKIIKVRQLQGEIKGLEKSLEEMIKHLNNKDEEKKVRSLVEWSIYKKREKISSIKNVIKRQWEMRKDY